MAELIRQARSGAAAHDTRAMNGDHFLLGASSQALIDADADRQIEEVPRRIGHVGNHVGHRIVGIASLAGHAEEIDHPGRIEVGGNLLNVVRPPQGAHRS